MASHLAGLGNIRDMSREDVAKLAADAYAAVKEGAEKMIADMHKPCEVPSRRRFERIAFAMFIHDERPLAVRVSPDGDIAKAQWLPRSLIDLNKETDEFAMVVMPGGIAIDRRFAQAKIPTLTDKREWTSEQREAWKRLRWARARFGEARHGEKWKRRYARAMKSTSPRPR